MFVSENAVAESTDTTYSFSLPITQTLSRAIQLQDQNEKFDIALARRTTASQGGELTLQRAYASFNLIRPSFAPDNPCYLQLPACGLQIFQDILHQPAHRLGNFQNKEMGGHPRSNGKEAGRSL